jgi:hypothetical protein
MGTNYYLFIANKCPYCDHILNETKQHVGKSSYGWKFIFNPFCKSFKKWKELIAENVAHLFDEYHNRVNPKDFYEMVESKQKCDDLFDHPNECYSTPDEYVYYDEDGYIFSKEIDFQ